MILIKFILIAVIMEQSRCEMGKRWCKKVRNKLQNVAGAEKQNKTVKCSDLYKFLQQGWIYDELKMKALRENETQPNNLERDQIVCHIYKNEKINLQSVETTALECCNGWSGDKCQHRSEKLGTCFYDDRCSQSKLYRNEITINRRVFSKASCCNLLGGTSWQSLNEHSFNSTSNKCLKCSNTDLERDDSSRTCISINEDNYIKFGGKRLKFSNQCAYRLATAADGTWWIDIQNQPCINTKKVCSKKLRISTQDGVIITLIDEDIYLSEDRIPRRRFYTKQGVSIQQNDKFVTLKTSIGVTVRWDRRFMVMVILDEDLPTVSGLCGAYLIDGDWSRNDITKPTGQIDASTNSAFLNIPNIRQCSLDTSKPKCSGSNLDIASRTCSFVLDAHVFTECRQIVDPFVYFEVCVSSLCNALDTDESTTNAFCDVMTTYMLSCVHREGRVEAWMEETGCSWNCPSGMEFIECASECPSTCNSNQQDDQDLCYENCVPGCQCPPNTVLNPTNNSTENRCIHVDHCPCKHRGEIYEQGAVIQRDCNTCFCGSRGVWSCSSNLCHGVCHVISARRVITFDDSKYSFDASVVCRHQVFVQTRSRDFVISAEIMRAESIDDVSDLQHVRSVMLKLRESRINLKRNFKLVVNGSYAATPFRNNDITIRQATTHSWLVKGFGFTLYWTPHSEQIIINLEAPFADRVFGLCGTFNWNPHDDFTTLDGAIEKVSNLFVRNFQLTGNWDSCLSSAHNESITDVSNIGDVINNLFTSDPCATHTQRKAKAQELCGILDDYVFQTCRSEVDVEAYEEACYFDVCRSHDNPVKASCRSLSSYAQACLQLHNKNSSTLNWRSHSSLNGQCDIQCPSYLTFNECQPISTSFCSDVSQPLPSYNNKTVNEFENIDCLPGCTCSKNQYIASTRVSFSRFETPGSLSIVKGLAEKGFEINDETFQCVPIFDCPCDHRGKTFEAGRSFKTGCVNCLCKAGKWNCTSSDCGAIVQCPNNLVFSHSMSLCDQLTCENSDNLEIIKERGDCSKEMTFQGCKCEPGYVLQDNRCILPAQCPCYYSGKIYDRNQTRKQDCNTCTCAGRRWSCTNEKCSSQCVVTGDPHYVTFDGNKYSFQGTCSYILSREINGLFTITSENVPCGFNDVTCTKSVFVTVGSNTVHLLRGKKVTINGVRVARLPRRYGDHEVIKYPHNNNVSNNDVTTMAIDTSGIYIVVTWPMIGLSVLWDGGTRVVIQLSPIHSNKVVGLCGNFDNNLINDFTTSYGSVETLQTIFADSWKVSPFCSETTAAKNSIFMNPCEANLHRSSWARKKCDVIENGILFSECRKRVPHTKFYEWCVMDACACHSGGDCECVCTAIAAYAQRCNQNNVPVRWRSQDLCPIQCENGAVYMECGPVCQKTCQNKEQLQPGYCSTLSCVEGCFCPPDTVLHNQHCIPVRECPCFYEGGEFYAGTMFKIDCQNCTCADGNWECLGEKCNTLAPSCGKNEFLCKENYQCIPDLWQCDYEFDCFDGSDEVNCNRTLPECQIVGGHFCDETKCLSIESRCDDIADCQDNSDEINCDVIIDQEGCDSDQFACDNGKCISNGLVCNGHYNCGFGDYSDENSCAGDCSILTHVPCLSKNNNTTCINRHKYCDGIIDCPNSSDETDCVCDVTDFTCSTLQCIDRSHVCNGIQDCEQGEDEMNCDSINLHPTSTSKIHTTVSTMFNTTGGPGCPQFQCESGSKKCLFWSQLCDDVIDCIDQSDETELCWQGCLNDEFLCDRGSKCLPMQEVCDGNPGCQDNSDENVETCENFNSTDFVCKGFKCFDEICINGSMVCDGVAHCLNNEDEIGCHISATTPPPSMFPAITTVDPTPTCDGFICLNRKCIALERICNGVDDCMDNSTQNNATSSDEIYCSMWNDWSNWGECSQTCGSGFQTRNRSCVPHSGQNKSNNSTNIDVLRSKCVGKNITSKPCFRNSCKNETHLTNWSLWSTCSASCGGGLSNRWRSCSDESCSSALSSGRNNLGPPILEIKSCAEHLCPDKTCGGNKIYRVCDGNKSDRICPLTCHDFVRGTGTNCVAQSEDGNCVSGCFCPYGFVAMNKSSDFCVRENECPCFEGGKVYEIGDEVLLTDKCEKCQCKGTGKWGNCVVDLNCEPPACGWTPWSNWGPCFGPCGVNGVQWAFRSPLRPSRYGAKQQCQGVHRKSRRCPTQQCEYCDVIDGKQRAVGEQWRRETCEICSCKENRTIHCTKYCEYAVTGCPNNQTLIQPSGKSHCCYCTTQTDDITPVIHDITTPSFNKEVLTETSTILTTTQGNQQFIAQTTLSGNKIETTPSTNINTGSTQDPNLTTTEPSDIGSGDPPFCENYEFQCKSSMECVSSSSICDGFSDCEDNSDESFELCQNYNSQCRYTAWSSWAECSKSCGLGKQMKFRGLKEESKTNVDCQGPYQLFRPCYESSCLRDGAWSSWRSWSQCSHTCGGGVQTRQRSCDSPYPLNGGRDCPGVCYETKVCNAIPCMPGLCRGGKVFLNGTQCLRFRACSQTCADLSANVRCRTECVLRGELGGCFCPQGKYLQDGICVGINECRCTVNYNEYEPRSIFRVNNCHCSCNNGRTMCNNCSVDCGWSTWSSWSQCDRTCGSLGHTYRFRSPNNPPPSGENANQCLGESRQQKSCSRQLSGGECPPVWGEWQSWGECSTSCGVGRQERIRVCKIDDVTAPSSFCGIRKHFSSFRQNRKCTSFNQTLCSICSVEQQYKCSKCPQTCDSLNDEGFIGGKCSDDCVWGCHCPEGKYLLDGDCVDASQCRCDVSKYNLENNLATLGPAQSILIGCENCTCTNGRMVCTNHTRCESNIALWEWSGWSKWSPCSHSCVNIDRIAFESIGTKERSRKCLTKSRDSSGQNADGKCEGVSSQFTQCGLTICFEDSTWNNWQPWSQCDKSCNGGVQSRRRSCKEDQFNMKNCKGESVMVEPCNLEPCVDQKCPKNSRFVPGCRSCTVGNTCLGLSTEISNSQLCQNNNNMTMDNCDTGHCSCFNSTLWQNGQCVTQKHCNCFALGEIRKNGEKFNIGRCTTCYCEGGKIHCVPKKFFNGSNVCEPTECCFDIDDNWSAWSSCSRTCGVGVRRRFSLSSSNAAQYLGTWCQERVMEQEDCNIFQCEPKVINCTGNVCSNHAGNNVWSNWGECSSTCTGNNLSSWRHRYKLCQGDNICSKPYSETEVCNDSVLPECLNTVRTHWSNWSSCSTCINAVSNSTSYKTRTRICLDLLNNEISCPSGNNIEYKECDNFNCENRRIPTNDEECGNIINGSVFHKCGPECVQFCGKVKQCFSTCRSGCYCKKDHVLNHQHNACISQSQCKCVNPFNGDLIENGKTFNTSRQLCRCLNGSVSCEQQQIKGDWCNWSHWTTCTRSCGQQKRSRARSCSCPLPSNTANTNLACGNSGSDNHTDLTQTQAEFCGSYLTCNKSGNNENWTNWSDCSRSCIGGTQSRKRVCPTQPCEGDIEQVRPCHSNIACTTTNWEGWSDCSLSCGQGGIRIRSRSCLQNHDCLQRDLTQFSACQDIKRACPPTLTTWSLWSTCSQSCEVGVQRRSRMCKNGTHFFSLENCIPNLNQSLKFLVDFNQYLSQENQTRECVGKKCHNLVPGYQPEWSDWSLWSVCTGPCGESKQERFRECRSNGSTVNNNATCSGVGKTTRPCHNPYCSNGSANSCPAGMYKQRACDLCLNEENYTYRLPFTCGEISKGGSIKCNQSDCSEVCVCPDDKVTQNNDCLSAHECECADDQGNLFIGNTAWNKTSIDEYGRICRSECSCLIGRIACKPITCEESNCDVTEWGSWTSCNSSCYDYNHPSTRLRFRSMRFEPESSGLNCNETLIEVNECRHLQKCGDDECRDDDNYQNKTWSPNECVTCSCHRNRSKSCLVTCGDSPHCVDAIICPEVTCQEGESKQRKTGNCCPTCHKVEKDFSCEMSSELRNFSLDGCRSRDTEVNFCTGGCRSSVYVLPYEPFFENKCNCCRHTLHADLPYISVELNCLDNSKLSVQIPNIAKCSCENCGGFTGSLQAGEP